RRVRAAQRFIVQRVDDGSARLRLVQRRHHNLPHFPAQMSGGEQQRVALARASAPRPEILLADEPTGNLDGTNGSAITDLLFGLQERHGATLVLVTHSPELAAKCSRVIQLRDGRIEPEHALAAAQ
ncbi:MAG: ATP-binding cassette domain-containing protein, partial [Pseudomonadota bacterium]